MESQNEIILGDIRAQIHGEWTVLSWQTNSVDHNVWIKNEDARELASWIMSRRDVA